MFSEKTLESVTGKYWRGNATNKSIGDNITGLGLLPVILREELFGYNKLVKLFRRYRCFTNLISPIKNN